MKITETQINIFAEQKYIHKTVISEVERLAFISGFKKAIEILPKWISVEERLPEYGEEYNCIQNLLDGGKPVVSITEFDAIEKKFCYPGTDTEQTGITHWMPLPEGL